MKFDKATYHVIKYISKGSGKITNGAIAGHFLGSEFNIKDTLDQLFKFDMIAFKDGKVYLSESGDFQLSKLENEELEKLQENIFESYDLAIIQFLYNRQYPIHLDDFPELLILEAPQHGNSINKGNIINYLYKNRKYINEEYGFYSLNDKGKAYYKSLIKQKESRKEIAIQQHFEHHIGDKIQNTTHGEGSFIAGRDITTELKKQEKLISELDDKLKQAQLELTKEQTKLTVLQSKEIRDKWKIGILSWFGGIFSAIIIAYLIGALKLPH